MNNSDQPLSEAASKAPERLHDTAGIMLRKARESANLTHAAVGEALHLTVHYIKALENDDYSKLPGTTFVKGYLRAYARFLKLDVNAVLASYEKNTVSAEELSNRTELLSRNQKRHDQTFRWAVVTAVIIVLGVAAGWWFVGKDEVAPNAVTVAQESLPPQTSRATTTATTTAVGPASRLSVAQSNNTAAGFVSAQTVSSSTAGQVGIAANSAADQTSSTAFNQSQIVSANVTPAAGTTTVIGTTVTNSASMPALNPVVPSNGQLTDTPSTIAAGAQSQIENSIATTALAASVSASPTILTSIPDEKNVAVTVTPTADGARQVTLVSPGADMLQLYFKGTSWVEIDDGAKGRLYNETLNGGDAMTLHGTAPFKVLLGDATQVELSYNSEPINLSSQIRNDKTARFSLGIAAAPSANSPTSQGANP